MRAADTIEFLTIEPQVVAGAEQLDSANGHEILGRVTLSRERFGVILDGLEAMVAAADSRYSTGCFSPGYALRESVQGGAVILICLECSRVEFARDGKGGRTTLNKSEAPDLEVYLSGLVTEFGLRTFMDPVVSKQD